MSNQHRIAAPVFAAAIVLAACQDATRPTTAEADLTTPWLVGTTETPSLARTSSTTLPSFSISGSDTPCTGILVGTFDNVVVPPGAFCQLTAIVHGNVKALEKSTLRVINSQVEGNVEGDKADIVQVIGSTVRQNVLIKESTFTPSGFVAAFVGSGTVILEGNIQVEKNVANAVRIGFGLAVNKGNIKVEDNVVEVFDISILNTPVAQNLQVFKNNGAGFKQVSGNTAGESIQCKENTPPFIGGPNTAPKKEDQCF